MTKKKYGVEVVPVTKILPVPEVLTYAVGWGGVAKCDRQQQRALNLLINLKIISFYTIYYSTILQ